MELTYMNSLLEDLKGRVERATLRSTNISLFPETVLALVNEVKRQREEIAALRAEVESRQQMYETEAEMRRQSEGLLETMARVSSDNAPAPEPAPVIADNTRVRITTGVNAGRFGSVVRTSADGRLVVRLDSALSDMVLDFEVGDVEPAPVEAIKVGDRVRINQGAYNGATGTVLSIDATSVLVKPTKGGLARDFHSSQIELVKD